jgi:hypothetical protein
MLFPSLGVGICRFSYRLGCIEVGHKEGSHWIGPGSIIYPPPPFPWVPWPTYDFYSGGARFDSGTRYKIFLLISFILRDVKLCEVR